MIKLCSYVKSSSPSLSYIPLSSILYLPTLYRFSSLTFTAFPFPTYFNFFIPSPSSSFLCPFLSSLYSSFPLNLPRSLLIFLSIPTFPYPTFSSLPIYVPLFPLHTFPPSPLFPFFREIFFPFSFTFFFSMPFSLSPLSLPSLFFCYPFYIYFFFSFPFPFHFSFTSPPLGSLTSFHRKWNFIHPKFDIVLSRLRFISLKCFHS